MEKISGKIGKLAFYGDVKELKKLYYDLRLKKCFLDDFFDDFLNRYGEKLHYNKTDTAKWKVYNKNIEEYHQVEQYLKQLNYYLKKFNKNV